MIELLTCGLSARYHADDEGTVVAVIGSTSRPVIATGRILDDVRDVAGDCVTVWCRRCKRATEYRYLTQLEVSA